jgi:hypothetical protein
MKYLKTFNSYYKINESEVKYDKSLVEDILEYLSTFYDLPEVDSLGDRPQEGYKFLNDCIKLNKELKSKSQEFKFKITNVIYNKESIIKGSLILKSFLNKDVSKETIKSILKKSVSQDDIKDLELSVYIIPYYLYEDILLKDKKNTDNKLVNGVFSHDLFDKKTLFKIDSSDNWTEIWRELCKDDTLYKTRISINIKPGNDAIYNKNLKYSVKSTLIHELTHLTQFINSFLLNIFDSFKNIDNSKDINVEFENVLKYFNTTHLSKSLKFGLPKKKFQSTKKDYDGFNLEDSETYYQQPVEFKTKMGDAIKKVFWEWRDNNEETLKRIVKSNDEYEINSLVKDLTVKILNHDEVKKIKGDKLKMKDIFRFLKKLIKS